MRRQKRDVMICVVDRELAALLSFIWSCVQRRLARLRNKVPPKVSQGSSMHFTFVLSFKRSESRLNVTRVEVEDVEKQVSSRPNLNFCNMIFFVCQFATHTYVCHVPLRPHSAVI